MLQVQLREALILILDELENPIISTYPVELAIRHFQKNSNPAEDEHHYRLEARIKNIGTIPISEWHLDLKIPTILCEPDVAQHLRVRDRSDRLTTLLRATNETHPGVIYPGDTTKPLTVDYRMNSGIFKNKGILDQILTAEAHVHGEFSARDTKYIGSITNY